MKARKPKIDTTEKVLRLGCGGFAGVFVGFYVTRYFWIRHFDYALLAALGGGLIFATLAVKFGDRFWLWWAD